MHFALACVRRLCGPALRWQPRVAARWRGGRVDSLAMPPRSSLRARLELVELPLELQLLVADEVDELADRAALCLALPALGLAALQRLARYEEILMSVALRLARLDQAGKLALLDERLIRLFAADDRASDDGCDWLNAVYAEAGSDLQVQMGERVGGCCGRSQQTEKMVQRYEM